MNRDRGIDSEVIEHIPLGFRSIERMYFNLCPTQIM